MFRIPTSYADYLCGCDLTPSGNVKGLGILACSLDQPYSFVPSYSMLAQMSPADAGEVHQFGWYPTGMDDTATKHPTSTKTPRGGGSSRSIWELQLSRNPAMAHSNESPFDTSEAAS